MKLLQSYRRVMVTLGLSIHILFNESQNTYGVSPHAYTRFANLRSYLTCSTDHVIPEPVSAHMWHKYRFLLFVSLQRYSKQKKKLWGMSVLGAPTGCMM